MVKFVSDRMSYNTKTLLVSYLIALNVHAPTEDKIDDVKESFYKELERMLDKFPKYHMKILLEEFNVRAGREDNFKLTIGNESLHKISNYNVI
jgi:hypothetical protein